MSIRGRVIVEHRNKNGRLLNYIDKHNTITELGKAASLFFGVSALGIPNAVQPGIVYPDANNAGFGSSADYVQTKNADTVVECELLSTIASDIAASSLPSLFVPDNNDIIGFAKEKTAATSLAAKEGIRVAPQNSNKQVITATAEGNTASFGFRWTGIEGTLHTVAMNIPGVILKHTMPDMFNQNYTFIPEQHNGVPAGKIAAGGSSYNKLLDLNTDAITDFTPTGSYVSVTRWCGLKFGDYIIECLTDQIRVTNTVNGTTYTENWSGLHGAWIEGSTLYIITYSSSFTCYSATVSDSAITATVVTLADHVASTWQNANYYFAGLSDGSVVLLGYIDSMSNRQPTKIVHKLTDTTAKMETRDVYDKALMCVYLDNIISYYTSSAIIPAGQFGWLFSYLDLESNWTINATDTVTVTYTYELEEVV